MEINFEKEVISKSKTIPVLVDFFATWCSPCKTLSSILEKIEKEYKGKFILVKINVDKNKELAKKYNILSIPNLKLFKNTKIVEELIGLAPESVIKKILDKTCKI